MKTKLLTLGLVGLLSSGCATSEWKRACNEVEIPRQCNCYDYSKAWSKEANRLGYNTRSVTLFRKEDKMMPHAIVELTQEDGSKRYIEPQNNWKVKVFKGEQIFATNYRNDITPAKTNYKVMPRRTVKFH